METAIVNLQSGKKAKVTSIAGGLGLQRRLRVMGIMEGKTIKVLTVQPFSGPIVLEVEGRQTTIGRGMAQVILVDEIK